MPVRLLILSTLLMAGCGGGDANQVPVYKVTGKVIMFGTPLSDASVSFSPKDKQPVATGRTDINGEFELTTYEYGDGAAEGNYAVLIDKAGAVAGAGDTGGDDEHSADVNFDPGASGEHEDGESSKSLVPPDYNDSSKTPLSATVTTDESQNVFEFTIN
ncbi:hypothetical protein KOR42_16590 [Thalassoglobus neptunius]|uniref:Carboxypeptidase regulatory-like domain-containing protein n=1 Tax=Thalassoglobus neptunius TaxID=1938619 RepID=A0A5C5X829_9PLAN|nr:hypothetical protein [Thalassoglobus neptunius]TWT58285.1 hypothetical protein KOR42_16590 [Thalassoglobus neptunius]